MKIEELYGKQFKLKEYDDSLIFKIENYNIKGRAMINWISKEKDFRISYEENEVLEYIKNGTWILIN